MTDHLSQALRDALHRATDDVGTPSLAATALREAGRRRARRRGAAAAALSSSLVVAVVVAAHVSSTTSVAPPPATPSRTPGESPSAVEQPTWDPADAETLPAASPGIAPALPDVIDPPESSPLLVDEPVAAAVVAVEEKGVAQVLTRDGEWRTVGLEEPYPRLDLSPDGTRLAISYYGGGDGVTVHDLPTGASRQLPFPNGYRPFDDTSWSFIDEDTLFLDGGDRSTFEVDATSGAAESVGYVADAFDADGAALEVDCCVGPRVLTDWADGTPREIALDQTGRLRSVHADATTVVGTSYDGRPFAVVTADRQTLTPRAVLPVRDRDSNYSNGGLSVFSLGEDGTVLLGVADIGGNDHGFRVVAWDPSSGALSLVSTNPVTRQVVVASGLVSEAAATAETASPAVAAPLDVSRVQPLWNPADVSQLSTDPDVTLVDALAPEGEAGALGGVALAAADSGGRSWLWGEGTGWRSTPYPEEAPPYVGRTLALTPDGSQLLVTGRTALWTRATDSTQWTEVPYPAGFGRAFDYFPSLAVGARGRIVLGQFETWWVGVLDGPDGGWTRLPFDELDEVVPAGDEVLARRFAEPLTGVVEEWRDGVIVRSTDYLPLQSLQRPVADETSIAVTRASTGYSSPRGPDEHDGLLALHRDGLTTRAFLPVPSGGSYYSDNQGLTALGWLDPDTVLFEVRPRSAPDLTWLVTWDVETGELLRAGSRVSGGAFAVAIDAL